jgi:hypothetical protein
MPPTQEEKLAQLQQLQQQLQQLQALKAQQDAGTPATFIPPWSDKPNEALDVATRIGSASARATAAIPGFLLDALTSVPAATMAAVAPAGGIDRKKAWDLGQKIADEYLRPEGRYTRIGPALLEKERDIPLLGKGRFLRTGETPEDWKWTRRGETAAEFLTPDILIGGPKTLAPKLYEKAATRIPAGVKALLKPQVLNSLLAAIGYQGAKEIAPESPAAQATSSLVTPLLAKAPFSAAGSAYRNIVKPTVRTMALGSEAEPLAMELARGRLSADQTPQAIKVTREALAAKRAVPTEFAPYQTGIEMVARENPKLADVAQGRLKTGGSPFREAYKERRAARGQAWTEAAESMKPGGAPEDVGTLAGRRKEIIENVRGRGMEEAREGAKRMEEALGARLEPHQTGGKVREALLGRKGEAEAGVRAGYEGVKNIKQTANISKYKKSLSAAKKDWFRKGYPQMDSDTSRVYQNFQKLNTGMKEGAKGKKIPNDLTTFDELEGIRQQANAALKNANPRSAGFINEHLKPTIDSIFDDAAKGGQFSAKSVRELKTARALRQQKGHLFERGASKDVFNKEYGDFKLYKSEVPGRYFEPGDKGFEKASQYKKITKGNKEQMAAMEEYAIQSFRNKAAPGGVVKPREAERWLREHDGALKVFPELKAKLSKVKNAQDAVDTLEAQFKVAERKYNKSALGQFTEGKESREVIHKMLRNKERGPAQIEDMMSKIGNDKAVLAGVREATMDYVSSKILNVREEVGGTGLHKLLKNKSFEKMFKQVFGGSNEWNRLKQIDKDMQSAGALEYYAKEAGGGGSDTYTAFSTVTSGIRQAAIDRFRGHMAFKHPAKSRLVRTLYKKFADVSEERIEKALSDMLMDPKLLEQSLRVSEKELVETLTSKFSNYLLFQPPRVAGRVGLSNISNRGENNETSKRMSQALSSGTYSVEPLKKKEMSIEPEKPKKNIVDAIIWQESRNRPNLTSNKGAKGIMQLTDATGKELYKRMGGKEHFGKPYDGYDPDMNKEIGTYFFEEILKPKYGNIKLALAGYNMGETNLDAWLRKAEALGKEPTFDNISKLKNFPRETREYVPSVLKYMES